MGIVRSRTWKMLKAETPSAAQKFVISADPTACFEIIYRDVIC